MAVLALAWDFLTLEVAVFKAGVIPDRVELHFFNLVPAVESFDLERRRSALNQTEVRKNIAISIGYNPAAKRILHFPRNELHLCDEILVRINEILSLLTFLIFRLYDLLLVVGAKIAQLQAFLLIIEKTLHRPCCLALEKMHSSSLCRWCEEARNAFPTILTVGALSEFSCGLLDDAMNSCCAFS